MDVNYWDLYSETTTCLFAIFSEAQLKKKCPN